MALLTTFQIFLFLNVSLVQVQTLEFMKIKSLSCGFQMTMQLTVQDNGLASG